MAVLRILKPYSLLLLLSVMLWLIPAHAQQLTSPLVPFADLPLAGNELCYLDQPGGAQGQYQSKKTYCSQLNSAQAGKLTVSNNDVRLWGAVCDGTTDDGQKINTALASGVNLVIIPSLTCRSGRTILVPDFVTLSGAAEGPTFPTGGSIIQCDLSVTPCVSLSSGDNRPAKIEKLTITRAAGTIPGGVTCILDNKGANVKIIDVMCLNHAKGASITSVGSNGIYAYLTRFATCGITDAHIEISGLPGVYVDHSQLGCNGSDNYTANRYVRVTGNWDATAGTIHFNETQFNQGLNTVVCGIGFENFTGTTNVFTDFLVLGGHMETAQNAVCTDSSVKGLTTFMFNGTWFGGGWGGANHIFADASNSFAAGLNPATVLNAINIGPDVFTGYADLVLDPTAQFNDVRIHDSSFYNQPITITGAASSTLQLVNNTYGGTITLAGSYGVARLSGIFEGGGYVNNTTAGTIEALFPGPNQNSAVNMSTSCKLAIGGSSTGITYTQQPVCQWSMAGNSVNADIYMSITSLGGLTGAATIVGALPYNAATSNVGAAILTCVTCASLTGPVIAQPGAASKTINLYETGAAGINTLTNTNIPASPTVLIGRISYLVSGTP